MSSNQTSANPPDQVIDDLSVSAKLVYKVLAYEGRLTQQEISEETHLVSRTVRHALSQLKEGDLVKTRPYLADARQQVYMIATEQSENGDPE